jgi:hypothetical protein
MVHTKRLVLSGTEVLTTLVASTMHGSKVVALYGDRTFLAKQHKYNTFSCYSFIILKYTTEGVSKDSDFPRHTYFPRQRELCLVEGNQSLSNSCKGIT